MGIGDTLRRTNFRLIIYGMFSNWGLVVLSNIIGLMFVNVIGIDLVKKFAPIVYGLLSIALYFPSPKSHDFRIGYMIAFVIGIFFLFWFYYPMFFGI